MAEPSDSQLLAEYVSHDSQEAFATLVRRHINLVYAAAYRQVGEFHKAQEVTQVVFLILAAKAAHLKKQTILPGWLYQTARLSSASFLRAERRRRHREHEAFMQSTLNDSPAEPAWEKLAPLLDEAMGRLGETDRNAIVLRFFEVRPISEVAVTLGLEEWAVRKRLERAVEKLRRFFVKRGVAFSAVAICGALSAHAAQATPPAALAAAVTATVTAKGATATTSTLTLTKGILKLMAWTKMKTAVVAGVVILLAAGTTTTLVVHHQHPQLPKPQPVAAGETDFPKSSWHFAGYVDPESAYQSCMWAFENGDTHTLLASMTSDMQKKLEGKTVLTAKDKADVAGMTGYRILNKQALSDSEVVLEVETDGKSQGLNGIHTSKIYLQRVGDEWKFDLKPKN